MPPAAAHSRALKFLPAFLLGSILVFAFLFCYEAGARGFQPFDQSIVFDGGYRVLLGQVPYKDFVIPFGPIVFYAQAAAFKLFGVNYAAYLFHAALANALAALAAFLILQRLFPSKPAVGLLGSFLTAVWFYPPFGTPWIDQTAFLFALFAALFALAGARRNGDGTRLSGCAAVLSGLMMFGAFLGKQNAGLYFLPVPPLLLLAAHFREPKRLLGNLTRFCAGFLLGAAGFFAWLVSRSDAGLFQKYFFETPFAMGERRFFRNIGNLPAVLFGGHAPTSDVPLAVRLLFLAAVIAVAVFAVLAWRSRKNREIVEVEKSMAAVLCIGCLVFQELFIYSTRNQSENSLPFLGLVFGCTAGLLLDAPAALRKKAARMLVLSFLAVLFAALAFSGVKVSLDRGVQDIFKGASFPRALPVPALSPLRFGHPTKIYNTDVSEEDWLALIDFLKAEKKNFFVFPDFTILYGVLNVPPPQPLVWFHKGLTYPLRYDPALDRWIVDGLERNAVEIVVVESISYFGTENRLDDFPLMRSFIETNYRFTRRFGNFLVFRFSGSLVLWFSGTGQLNNRITG